MWQVKYKVNGEYVCFKHAVAIAMADKEVETEVDEYDSEYDMRMTNCRLCEREAGNT